MVFGVSAARTERAFPWVYPPFRRIGLGIRVFSTHGCYPVALVFRFPSLPFSYVSRYNRPNLACQHIDRAFGLGVQPPDASWGLLINQGVETMEEYPWLLIYPALALTATLLCLNLVGDRLRDRLEGTAAGGNQ